MRLPLLFALYFVFLPLHAQWQMQDGHTTADLRGIDSLGNGVAWASGTNGTVLRTEDAGFVWQLCTVPPGAENLDFRGIQAFDNNTAIVMSSGKGDLSRLYKTTDGCQTWKLLFTNPDKDGFWDAVSFDTAAKFRDGNVASMKPSGEGWLLGDPSHGREVIFALEPSDAPDCRAGKHCSFIYDVVDQSGPTLDADASMQGSFAASNAALFALPGILCGPLKVPLRPDRSPRVPELWFATGGKAGAAIYRQRLNCGKFHGERQYVWDRMSVPIGSATESSGVFAFAFQQIPVNAMKKEFRGVAVGGDYLHPGDCTRSAAFSRSGGREWLASETQPHGYRSAVGYEKAYDTWITVGPNGTDFSTDDGRNWHALKPGPEDAPEADQHWNALSLPFVVGPHGRIGTLRDGALSQKH